MKRNLTRFAAALLLTSAAITCSLTVWANPAVRGKGVGVSQMSVIGRTPDPMKGDLESPFGSTQPTVAPPFDTSYSLASLGFVPGVVAPYGGLTFKYDDPNTLLIGGGAGSSAGHIYQIAVTRDLNGHVVGFSGSASIYPTNISTLGQYNDGGVMFGPGNVLFVTHYPLNEVEQSKPGSVAPDKITDMTPLGIPSSGGSIAFVPPGFPGAGSMKIASFGANGWFHCEFAPDGNGTFNITAASLRVSGIGGAEGIAFVPPDSPVFPSNSVLIVQYTYSKVITAPLDVNGDPILAQSQDFVRNIVHGEGACIDPVTGDFLFSTWGAGNEVIRVGGFATPSPTPTPTPGPSCTPGPWSFRADYPFAADSGALATDGTFAYAFGGSSSTGGQHIEANRYDPVTNTWMPLADMTTGPDFYLHAEYGGNGKIYVMGGAAHQRSNRIYTIASDTWSEGMQMPENVYSYGHAYANGKIYVIGGVVDGFPSNAVYAYDVASDSWSAPLAPLPQAEYQITSGVINNKIYVAGGVSGDSTVNSLYIYDIATNAWTSGPPMLVGAESPAGAVVDGKLWVIGGRDPLGAFMNNTQIYDPVTNNWSNGPTLNMARSYADAVTLNVAGGQMPVIVGGYKAGFGSLSSVEADLVGCAQTTPTPTPTATATATVTPTATATPTASATGTPTVSPSPTVTPSTTPSPTLTPTPSATATPTSTPSSTPSTTPTASPSATATPSSACVLGQSYWKNQTEWPVNQLQLGNRTYNRQELQAILRQPPRGNSLVQLAHQEIAAKVNIATGADGSCVTQVLAAADAMIGNLVIPPVGNGHMGANSYVRTLANYNNGGLCVPKCDLPWSPGPSPRPTARPYPSRAPRP